MATFLYKNNKIVKYHSSYYGRTDFPIHIPQKTKPFTIKMLLTFFQNTHRFIFDVFYILLMLFGTDKKGSKQKIRFGLTKKPVFTKRHVFSG